MNEFELIRDYFTQQAVSCPDVIVGIGDDAAIVQCPAGMHLACTTDMLLEGVHFPSDTAAADIAYKSLAVNLSDLAAMGAQPLWFTLNLSLPQADAQWLQEFAQGLFQLAEAQQLQLIGGDTVRGSLIIGIQAFGAVPPDKALRRSGAQPGDDIYVSGTLGDAAIGLRHWRGELSLTEDEGAAILPRFLRPTPRIELGLALRGIASSAIDISDGLAADLNHIVQASAVGACVHLAQLPLSPVYLRHCGAQVWDLAISHGDDYELCFTVAPGQREAIQDLAQAQHLALTRIGTIEVAPGLRLFNADGQAYTPMHAGHDHFAAQ